MKALIVLIAAGLMLSAMSSCNAPDSSDDSKTAFGRVYNSTAYPLYNLKMGSVSFPTIESYQWSPSTQVPMGTVTQSWTWKGTNYSQTVNIAGDFNATYYGGYTYSASEFEMYVIIEE